jgi:5-(carboxyamino)imidazole ribonucleotide mutase
MSDTKVGIIMGSKSDLDLMKGAADVLDELGIGYELTILSAHRTPHRVIKFTESARSKGMKAIIAGAGMAAHLPGVIAAFTTLPVIGVPIKASVTVEGLDAILSILQMPPGVPVATVALNGSRNAGILAAQIIGAHEKAVEDKLAAMKDKMREKVEAIADEVEEKGFRNL